MADYDCDFCSYVEKCKRQYEELDCPYNAVKIYSKEECLELFCKANEIMRNINEFMLLDHEDIFEDIFKNFRYKLEFEVTNLIQYKTKVELEEMINE